MLRSKTVFQLVRSFFFSSLNSCPPWHQLLPFTPRPRQRKAYNNPHRVASLNHYLLPLTSSLLHPHPDRLSPRQPLPLPLFLPPAHLAHKLLDLDPHDIFPRHHHQPQIPRRHVQLDLGPLSSFGLCGSRGLRYLLGCRLSVFVGVLEDEVAFLCGVAGCLATGVMWDEINYRERGVKGE